jgi:hypothetical protein
MTRLLLAGLLIVAVAACGGSSESAPQPGAGPGEQVAHVERAARATIERGPASIRLRVSSPRTRYRVSGAIDLSRDRFRLTVRVDRAEDPPPRRSLRVVGFRGETYAVTRALAPDRSRCLLDLHAPIGRFGGGMSVQEAVTLTGVVMRLLSSVVRRAAPAERTGAGKSYRVRVDARRATVARSSRQSDELVVVRPKRLAKQIAQPVQLTVADDVIPRLFLRLPRFVANRTQPVRFPAHGREPVDVRIRLDDFGGPLRLNPPRCRALE